MWCCVKYILTHACLQILLVAKLVAAILSGSLSVVSSLIDSAVDLISGALMYWSARAVKYRDIYQYPQGTFLVLYYTFTGPFFCTVTH